MTQLAEETAATSFLEVGAADAEETTASTAIPTQVSMWRPGLVVATAVLLAALSSGGSEFGAFGSSARRKEGDEFSDAGTAVPEIDADLLDEIRTLFDEGATEFFHDGLHSEFSRSLLALIASRGNAALRAIGRYVLSDASKPDVVSEALRWLADHQDSALANEQWRVLLQALRHPDPRVRDGAVIGFSSLDNPRALPVLKAARGAETIHELGRLLDVVIEQLTQTAHVAAAPDGQREQVV